MAQNKITILSTRQLNETLIEEALQQGIEIDVEAFIETEAIVSSEVQQEIEQVLLQSATIVFTSIKGVEAVAEFMSGEMPDWNIYCVGQTTMQLARNYFGANCIAGIAGNAADLAELIIVEAYTDEVIFFCGDQRRNELPDILSSNDIEVNEIIVYHTVATPHAIKKIYNGILFFSPSAADSFFVKNKINGSTILFAIGNTTAATIKKYTGAGVIISDKPVKENLIEKVINYFVNSER
jgi:uroporphyrinogen-III synthase